MNSHFCFTTTTLSHPNSQHPHLGRSWQSTGHLPKPWISIQGPLPAAPPSWLAWSQASCGCPALHHDRRYWCLGITQPFEKSQPLYLSPLISMAALQWINRILSAELHDMPRQSASVEHNLSGEEWGRVFQAQCDHTQTRKRWPGIHMHVFIC